MSRRSWLAVSLCIFMRCGVAEPVGISWDGPWTQNGFQATGFVGSKNGFEVYVASARANMDWGIQVRGLLSEALEPGRWEASFSVASNQAFELCSRLGDQANKKNYYTERDTCISVPANERRAFFAREFIVEARLEGMMLYVLLGKALARTKVNIKDVQLKSVR